VTVTAGSLVYPDPPEVTVMPVTKPAVIVATAVAGSPANARPIESDINTATVISHLGTFITGKLPFLLGFHQEIAACNRHLRAEFQLGGWTIVQDVGFEPTSHRDNIRI
jgi:hypothetical protein